MVSLIPPGLLLKPILHWEQMSTPRRSVECNFSWRKSSSIEIVILAGEIHFLVVKYIHYPVVSHYIYIYKLLGLVS